MTTLKKLQVMFESLDKFCLHVHARLFFLFHLFIYFCLFVGPGY